MADGYFHRVTAQTPTRFWINNPTREEAEWAIAAGAISSTTNPSYAMKQIQREQDFALSIIDGVIRETASDDMAADLVQQRLVAPILERFLPLYEQKPGKQGVVSIQGNPLVDSDAGNIVEEALCYRNLGRNFIAKIPVTRAGLEAIETLVAEDVPIIATEVMAIAQATAVCDLYQRISTASGKHPPFYLTHITGIFDEHLANVVRLDHVDISRDSLWQAGCIVARRQCQIIKERKYPVVMLGGGARGLHHFTEMVGSEVHVTINWAGTADKLIADDPPVVSRASCLASEHAVDELLDKIPDFARAYHEDGLDTDEFASFGPVVLFRDSFVQGWQFLLDTIRSRRGDR